MKRLRVSLEGLVLSLEILVLNGDRAGGSGAGRLRWSGTPSCGLALRRLRGRGRLRRRFTWGHAGIEVLARRIEAANLSPYLARTRSAADGTFAAAENVFERVKKSHDLSFCQQA